MSSIDELKKKGFQFINRLYEKTGGSIFKHLNMWEIGQELGFNKDETDTITQYLVGEYLIEHKALGKFIAITHEGVKEVESALSEPDQSSQYFPPVNIINIQHMEASQIQQGTINNEQKVSYKISSKNDISTFIDLLKSKVPELNLSPDDKSEVEAEITTIEAQLSSSRPKNIILKECLNSIKNILEGTSSSLVASQLLPYIPALINAL